MSKLRDIFRKAQRAFGNADAEDALAKGSIGDDHFFDVSFTVSNLPHAAQEIWLKLAELGVQAHASISCSDGTTYTRSS